MGLAHISHVLGNKSSKGKRGGGKSRKAYKHSWCLPGDNEETFVHHPWEEEPEPEPDGSTTGILFNTGKITYSVSNRKIKPKKSMALVDRGANGIVVEADCVWIGGPDNPRYVNIIK